MTAPRSPHPTERTLLAYGLGDLDADAAGPVGDHVLSCPDCRRRLDELSGDRLLGRLREGRGGSGSPGPLMSATAGPSMQPTGPWPPAPLRTATLPPGLADHADYEIMRELGRGGMGVVYLARNRLMGRTEVLKVVGRHLVDRGDGLDRFLAEIRHAARLHHPNIVTAYSAHRIGESLVLAMEYVEGLDLSRLVKASGPLPVANACHYAQQAALGLQHADEHGMVHRDIKPSNLMLARQGSRAAIKILDFGLARVRSEGTADVGLTHEGQMLGTPAFIAPEQIRDARHADIRADIYSLGCTLYYLLAGSPPFRGECLYDVLQAHHSMEAMPLNLKRPEVPTELAALVAKMMAKEPERRFQSPKEVAQALTPFFKKGETTPRGPGMDLSRGGRSDTGHAVPEVVSAPASPATDAAGPVDRPGTMAGSTPSGPRWEILIDRRDAEPSRDEASRARPRSPWTAAAVGVFLLSLLVAWAIVVRLRTPAGIIEMVGLPAGASVFVDGERAEVNWPGGGKPAIISVAPGRHRVVVKNDDVEISGSELTVRAEGTTEFTVRFVPIVDSPPVEGDGDDLPAGSDVMEEDSGGSPPDPSFEVVNNQGTPRSADEPPTTPDSVVERETPAASPAPQPAVGKPLASPSAFVPLFNGRNLAGWKTHPKQPGHWHVANGVLIGSGPAPSHLYTDRGDLTDFHLRLEACFNKRGSGGVYVRCPFGPSLPADDPKWPDGFEATINNARIVRRNTGGIYPGDGNDVFVGPFTTMPPGAWFTLDVIVDGGVMAVLVNGKPSGYHIDKKRLFTSGHIALQQYNPETVIWFRKIEIMELNRPDQKDPKEIGRHRMGRVSRVAFSTDGRGMLAAAYPNETWHSKNGTHWWSGGAGSVRFWEVASGRNAFNMAGEGWPVVALALSSDGRSAASHGPDHPILIWDLKSGKRIHRLAEKDPVHKPLYTAVSFSPDDRRVMAATKRGTVLVWDLASGREEPPINLDAGPTKLEEFTSTSFSPDRRQLVTGRRTGPVELWDLQGGRRLRTFAGHAGEVHSVACSADGQLILSVGSDNTVRLWNAAGGKELKRLVSDDRGVLCIAFSPDSRHALSAGIDGPVHLWDLASGREVCRMEGHTMKVNSVAFSPDGRQAVSGSDDRTMRLWQLPASSPAGSKPSGAGGGTSP